MGLKFIKNIDNNGLQSIVKDSYYLFVRGVHACVQKQRPEGVESPHSFEAGSLSELRVHISARLEVSQHQ